MLRTRFRSAFLGSLRVATFSSLALVSIITVIHGFAKYGWTLPEDGIEWLLFTLSLNITAATAYATMVRREQGNSKCTLTNSIHGFQRDDSRRRVTYLGQAISYFILWLYLLALLICLVFYKLSILFILMLSSA